MSAEEYHIMIFREPATHQIEMSVDSLEDGMDFMNNPKSRYRYRSGDILVLVSSIYDQIAFRYKEIFLKNPFGVYDGITTIGDYHIDSEDYDELMGYGMAWNTFWNSHKNPKHLMQVAYIHADKGLVKNAFMGILRSKNKTSKEIISGSEKYVISKMLDAIKSGDRQIMENLGRYIVAGGFSDYGRAVSHLCVILSYRYDIQESTDDIGSFFSIIHDESLVDNWLSVIRRNIKLEDILTSLNG